MVEETYQVAEMEDADLQISTAEVDSVVVKANTTENAAPEEDQSHIQAEKYFYHQDSEVEDNSAAAAAAANYPEVFGHEEISAAADPTSSEQLDPSILATTSQQSHVTTILGEAFLIPSPNPTAIPDHHKTTIIGAPTPAPPHILATRAHRSWLTILTTRRLPREQPIFPRIWRTSLGVRRQARYYTGYSNALRVEMDDVYGFGGVLAQFPVWPASRYTSGATLGTFEYI